MRIAVLHHGTSSSIALSRLRCALSCHRLAERRRSVEAVQRLNREFAKALDLPELKAAYEAGGRQIVTGTSQAMADMLRKGIPEWEVVVGEAGMNPG